MDGCGSRPPRSQSSGVRVVAKIMDQWQGAEAHNFDDGYPTPMCVSFSDDGHAIVSICPEAKNSRSAERSVYQLDYCYEEEKGAEEIYEVEVRPLVQRLFEGTNCCVISYGAQQSWPAQLFQGSGGNLSLAEKTMSEILHKDGKGIELSEYEVFQDQIYDLLEPKEKGFQLKGLSKVRVNTVDEFKSYYCQSDRLIRGHRGLIIYTSHRSKLNFLDLGGYGGATENKSLYAVMKIVYALNSKNHISYRDSRLTHQLHDFLSWESRSVVIACLSRSNNQQNRRSLMLASSSSQVFNKVQFNTIRRPTKQYVAPLEKRYSMAVTRTKSVYENVNRRASARHTIKKLGLVKKRIQSGAAISMAKLSVDKDLFNATQVEKSTSEVDMHGELADSQACTSSIPGEQQEVLSEEKNEAICTSNTVVDNEESAESGITNALTCYTQQEEISGASKEQECKEVVIEETSSNHTASEDSATGEEGRTPARLTEPSPKVSDRLREISNSLKFIPDSRKLVHIGTPKRVSFSSCTLEAKTPNKLSCMGFEDSALQCADMPQESLIARTTGMKKSLQRDCLTFINSANKEDLKRLKGIGEVRANRILQLRDNNPEPFKDVEDLKNIGITQRQFDRMLMNFFEDC